MRIGHEPSRFEASEAELVWARHQKDTRKQTVEEALRLMIRLHRQHEVDAAFGSYRWRGNLARSRTGRGAR